MSHVIWMLHDPWKGEPADVKTWEGNMIGSFLYVNLSCSMVLSIFMLIFWALFLLLNLVMGIVLRIISLVK